VLFRSFVDDEDAIVQLARVFLERLGYSVIATNSSVEALSIFRTTPDRFDAVITDLSMPNLTGAELARSIHQIRNNTPIILCTGFSEMSDEKSAESLGVRELIMKPLTAGDLGAALLRILGQSVESGST